MQGINFFAYWPTFDGYGRFAARMVQALQRAGCDVRAIQVGELQRPPWLLDQLAIDWARINITCAPPTHVRKLPRTVGSRHYLYSMTEGSQLPDGWVASINAADLDGVIVPCPHNDAAFRASGVECPTFVVPGGTDPAEFPLIDWTQRPDRPYTFLTFADRHERKGWFEVWEAFYQAFGGKSDGVQDVRLIIKGVRTGRNVIELMAEAHDRDPRIVYRLDTADDMAAVYAEADCLVLPSRSEGWGMIHRECAMMGVPVITQAYSGLADADQWAITVKAGKITPISQERSNAAGEYRIVDVVELAEKMRHCYDDPAWAQHIGARGATWLRELQTWDHMAARLIKQLHLQQTVEWPVAQPAGER